MDYEKSLECKYELRYAQKRGRTIIPCLFTNATVWTPSGWLKHITTNLQTIEFDDTSEAGIRSTVNELIYQIREQSSVSQYLLRKAADQSCYLFELIRYEYERNSRIEHLIDPSESFPIEQSYINLAMVKAKEQQKKEQQLSLAQDSNIMSTFEEIYGTKAVTEIQNIFDSCEPNEKKVLVFGRAGIGKSTFCRYVAYQWASGSFWPQYELLALIPLRHLTSHRYSANESCSLLDLVRKEVFSYELTEADEMLLKKHFDSKKTLWILDGYDEIVKNVPPHLECLLEQLLKMPHHIITSRPYLNTLAYGVQMEITGFTDENIKAYVQQFFEQIKDDGDDATIKSKKLFNFLKNNASVWGIAHIPVNLDLICSLWRNQDLPETEQMTIPILYSMLTEWLCRRYLRTQSNQILQLSKEEVDHRCEKELIFLEKLAFRAMENNTIIIRKDLLKEVLREAKISSEEYTHVLKIGILKSFHKPGFGTRLEVEKDHYFVHLSFQEYFAARYLINALKNSRTLEAIEFIKRRKYNQRYALVFIFASGLSPGSGADSCLTTLWNTILSEPLDLVGIRHIQLVISCVDGASVESTLPRRDELLKWIAECLQRTLLQENTTVLQHLLQSLKRAPSLFCAPMIQNVLMEHLQCTDMNKKAQVLSFISALEITHPWTALIISIGTILDDKSKDLRIQAGEVLGKIGEKAAIDRVVSQLVKALRDDSEDVRQGAYIALGKIGEKAATNEVLSQLVKALRDENETVRQGACIALGRIGEKAAINRVISQLVKALRDEKTVRRMHVRLSERSVRKHRRMK